MTAASSLPPSSRAGAGSHESRATVTIEDAHRDAKKKRAGRVRYTNGTGEMPRARPIQLERALAGRSEAEQLAAE